MADDKKAGSPKTGTLESLIFFIFGLIILSTVFGRLIMFLSGNPDIAFAISWSRFADRFSHNALPVLSSIAFALSTFFIFGIAWVISKLSALNKELNAIYTPLPSASGEATSDANARWERVLEHLNSSNPNDWKFSVLEADIMLADLLDTLQLPGITIADKLKSVEPSDFTTLEQAWEAHKIRNTIAHEGGDFVITEREARRVIDLYRVVFEEFHII